MTSKLNGGEVSFTLLLFYSSGGYVGPRAGLKTVEKKRISYLAGT
jgi:hypothetical protein